MSGNGQPESDTAPVAPPELAGPSLTTDQITLLLDLVPDAAVAVAADGRIVAANHLAEAAFGYGNAGLTGKPVESLVPERLRSVHRRNRASFMEQPRSRSMGVGLDLHGRRADGSEFPVDISLAPLRVGDEVFVVAAIRDITERRHAMAAQAQLAALVRSSHDAIIGLSLEGRVTSWNPGAERLLGWRAEDRLGTHFSDLVPEDESAGMEDLLGAAMTGAHSNPIDTRWLQADGGRVDVSVSVSPLWMGTEEPTGFSVMVRDITERKQAEVALRRQERWQAATSEIRLHLLSNEPVGNSLALICRRVVDLVDAQAAMVVTGDGDEAQLAAQAGLHHAAAGTRFPFEALGAGNRPGAAAAEASDAADEVSKVLSGSTVVVPIPSERLRSAAFAVALGDRDRALTRDETLLVESMAAQAALAFEFAHARADREQILLSDDRERIARDLHDLVIQRLFGTGMGLEAALRMIDNERAAARVAAAVEDLDATIKQIRTAIFELEAPAAAEGGLRQEILATVGQVAESLGFDPAVRFSGPVDSAVSRELAAQVVAVVREALTNVAKHAGASAASVDVNVDDDLALVVEDNGIGSAERNHESGLANLRERAERLEGRLDISRPHGGGTRLAWRVPLGTP